MTDAQTPKPTAAARPVPAAQDGLRLKELPSSFADLRWWWLDLDQPLPGEAAAWLSDAERTRAARFVFPPDRHRYTTGRAALRQVLGMVVGCRPDQLVLDVGASGKPVLMRPAGCCHFNLSHCGDAALLAVSQTRAVGIDLERVRELPDAQAVAAEMFSAQEQSAWAALPVAQQARAFMRLWTRKEACLKAWGVGLGLDPRRVVVGGAAGGLIIEPPDPLLDGPLWLESLSLPDNPGFEAAVALGTAGSTRRAKESLPESECRPFSSEPPKGGSLLPTTRP